MKKLLILLLSIYAFQNSNLIAQEKLNNYNLSGNYENSHFNKELEAFDTMNLYALKEELLNFREVYYYYSNDNYFYMNSIKKFDKYFLASDIKNARIILKNVLIDCL